MPAAGEEPRLNMAQHCLARHARETPRKTALIVVEDLASATPAEVWSYAELEDAVLRTAQTLRDAGLRPGDRLVIRLENTSFYAILFFAAVAAGLVPVPASSELTAREVRFLVDDSAASAIALAEGTAMNVTGRAVVLEAARLADESRRAPRAAYAKTRPDDPAFLIYTSGTTAEPKGVLHAHRSVLGRRPMYRGWYGIGPADRMLHAGAFNWTFTLGTGLSDPWANGATAIVYTGEKEPAVWPRLIARTEATLFACVPGLVRRILKYAPPRKGDLPSLRHGLIAGETPPPGLFEDWTAHTGTALYEALGMSEISTYISTSPEVPRRPGAVGKSQPGRRVAILPLDGPDTGPLPPDAEGLIGVHRTDPGLMLGYWNRPGEETAVYRGEWFLGGDIGIMDAGGYIAHRGRANEIMKALGYRVSPLEVEAVLTRHPDVLDVACAEVPVRDGVSVVGAFIVPRDPAAADAEAIRAFASGMLAAYKCPREIRFVDALPRTPNGKVKRGALSAIASSRGVRI